ncbi:ORF6N domain-containing protein [Candidatus Parvarchaeota archaeon]|nr:ORF6N domain-containing protein [Candidatus Parvarchaeota archaeon]
MESKVLVPIETIEQKILLIRGQKVMLDRDLAILYGAATKRLNEQVKRNRSRFPDDFMFQLTVQEKAEVVANCDHLKNLKFSYNLPYAFTEHGAIMVANILNSKRAIEASIYVVRAFIKLRGMLLTNKELSHKLSELERKVGLHDEAIRSLVIAIKELMTPPEPKHRKIGFL